MEKENSVQRRNSIAATLGGFLRKPLAQIALPQEAPNLNDTNDISTVQSKGSVARTISLPSYRAVPSTSTNNEKFTNVRDISFANKPQTVCDKYVEDDHKTQEFKFREPVVPASQRLLLKGQCEEKLETSVSKRPAVWAPVVQPRQSGESPNLNNSQGTDDEEKRNFEIKRNVDKCLLLYYPYFEESIRLQIEKEESSRKEKLACSKTMRNILVDWIAMLQTFLKQRSFTLHLGVRIMDEILATHSVEARELQLVALGAFWIASKMDSKVAPITIKQLLPMCKHAYTQRLILRTEIVILRGLNFNVPRDTCHSIVTYHVHQLSLTDKQRSEARHMAGYLLDVTLFSWDASFIPLSNLASSATLCALELLSIHAHSFIRTHVQSSQVSTSMMNWNELCQHDEAFKSVEKISHLILKMLQLLITVQSDKSNYEGIRYKNSNVIKHFDKQLSFKNIERVSKEIIYLK